MKRIEFRTIGTAAIGVVKRKLCCSAEMPGIPTCFQIENSHLKSYNKSRRVSKIMVMVMDARLVDEREEVA